MTVPHDPQPAPAPAPARASASAAGRGGRGAAVLVLLAIFLAGAGAGVALDRLVLLPQAAEASQARPRFGPPSREQRQAYQDSFARALDLTPEQRVRVDSVMARQTRELRAARASLRPRVDSLLAETRRELDSVLTADQRRRLEAMRRERGFGRMPGGGPPPRAHREPRPDGRPDGRPD